MIYKEEATKIYNVVEEIKGYQNQIARLKKKNNLLKEKIEKISNELEKDRMEQFDDYVIYLLSKYIDILRGDKE